MIPDLGPECTDQVTRVRGALRSSANTRGSMCAPEERVVLLVSDRRWMESIIQMYLLSARRSHESGFMIVINIK